MADKLTHFDEAGRARMVDVAEKPATARRARARGRVTFSPESFEKVRAGVAKGDIARIAELAGIMGAKRTADLIPLCHPLPLSSVVVEVAPDAAACAFRVTAEARATATTGVEMEALTAVMTACLTIYDMAKAVDKGMRIEGVELVEKSGGASGDFRREA